MTLPESVEPLKELLIRPRRLHRHQASDGTIVLGDDYLFALFDLLKKRRQMRFRLIGAYRLNFRSVAVHKLVYRLVYLAEEIKRAGIR
jgi:hypothetical protein